MEKKKYDERWDKVYEEINDIWRLNKERDSLIESIEDIKIQTALKKFSKKGSGMRIKNIKISSNKKLEEILKRSEGIIPKIISLPLQAKIVLERRQEHQYPYTIFSEMFSIGNHNIFTGRLYQLRLNQGYIPNALQQIKSIKVKGFPYQEKFFGEEVDSIVKIIASTDRETLIYNMDMGVVPEEKKIRIFQRIKLDKEEIVSNLQKVEARLKQAKIKYSFEEREK